MINYKPSIFDRRINKLGYTTILVNKNNLGNFQLGTTQPCNRTKTESIRISGDTKVLKNTIPLTQFPISNS